MSEAAVFCKSISVQQKKGPDITDISHEIAGLIKESGIMNGSADITAVGSTGSVTTIEYEPGVIEDLKTAMNQIAPPDAVYQHELAWHDGNGHSHVQAAVMGPSISVPVRKGSARLGTWQQIVAINHDNHARQRVIEVTIIGI